MSPRKKKLRRWWFTAGEPPFTVAVHERTPGGTLYERAWDPSTKQQVRRSLGHRDKERAQVHAIAAASRLKDGAAILVIDGTVGSVLRYYTTYRTPQKPKDAQAADRRMTELWLAVLGSEKRVSKLGREEWESFIRRRLSGEIDARGRVVAKKERTPVGPRTADADLVFLISVFNWACGWRVDGEPLLKANPWAAAGPGVKRALERPVNYTPKRPIATYDRFLKVRKASERVMMFARKGDEAATLVEVGRAQFTHGEGPVQLWMKPSYLPELLDLIEATGRRVSQIAQLRYSDIVRERGAITAIHWPPFKKRKVAKTVPVNESARAALERILALRPGIGARWLFPSPKKPDQPITRQLAREWLEKAEALAGVPHLDGGAFHPYRRKWATERKALPRKDVMEAGDWVDERSLVQSYEQADDETMLTVVNEPRKLVARQEGA